MHHAPSHLNPGYGYDHSFDYGHELSYADDYHDYLDHDDELRHIPVHELARIMPEGLHLHDPVVKEKPYRPWDRHFTDDDEGYAMDLIGQTRGFQRPAPKTPISKHAEEDPYLAVKESPELERRPFPDRLDFEKPKQPSLTQKIRGPG